MRILKLWMNPLLPIEERMEIADGEIARLERLLTSTCADLSSIKHAMIPIEPTTAMLEEGAKRLLRWQDDSVWPDSWTPLQIMAARNDAERVWRSMWLAAQDEKQKENENEGTRQKAQSSGRCESCRLRERRSYLLLAET